MRTALGEGNTDDTNEKIDSHTEGNILKKMKAFDPENPDVSSPTSGQGPAPAMGQQCK